MSLPAPLKISQQAEMIRQVLAAWAAAFGGIALICSNLRDMWGQASQSSTVPRLLIVWGGAEARGGFDLRNAWHREDREWIVAVTRGRGFHANRGDSLTETKGDEIPFYDIVEQVRDKLRSILNISEEQPTIDYKSIRPMQFGTNPIDGFMITVGTANDRPMILTQPENQAAI